MKLKAIIVNGKIISICEEPNYVKRHPEGHCFIPATIEDAEGISAGLNDDAGVYNLPNKPALIEDAPIAYIREDDGREYFYTTHTSAQKSAESIVEIENAICDNDAAALDRIAQIENILCDMDNA